MKEQGAVQRGFRPVVDARRTAGTAQGLAEGAPKIGEAVKLIAGFASRVNLLTPGAGN